MTIEALQYIEIILAVILIFLILIQNKNAWLSAALAWNTVGSVVTKKRWAEKFLHVSTIVVWILYFINSFAYFIFA